MGKVEVSLCDVLALCVHNSPLCLCWSVLSSVSPIVITRSLLPLSHMGDFLLRTVFCFQSVFSLSAYLCVGLYVLIGMVDDWLQVNLKELLSVSIELSERGGQQTEQVKLNHQKLNTESKGLTKEGKKEMKTDGDMQSHRAIMAGFHKTFPSLSSRVSSTVLTHVTKSVNHKSEYLHMISVSIYLQYTWLFTLTLVICRYTCTDILYAYIYMSFHCICIGTYILTLYM